MDLKEKKIVFGLVFLAILATIFTGFLAFKPQKVATSENPQNFGDSFNLSNCYLNDNRKSTTTMENIAAATSTMMCNIQLADHIDMNLMVAATSSSSSKLVYNYAFSNNGVDWFNQSVESVDSVSTISHSTGIVDHTFAPGTTATTTTNVQVAPVASKWIRVRFSFNTGNGSLWANLIAREPIR